MTDQPQYDRFSPRDDEALAALLRQAFGDTRAIVAWFRAALGDDAFRILRLGDQVAAELALVPMAQWFGGQAVPVVGVSAFSVAPAFRGQGFSTKLLRAMLEEAHERDFALATLYASTLTVYRKVGFEIAGSFYRYVINPVTMATLDRPLKMVPVAAEHHAVMKELQSAQAQRSSGQLERPEALWRFKLGPHDDVVDGHMLVSSAGPEGYVLASRKQRRRLDLVDWCALTPEAVRQVVRFLADARSIADQVSWIGGPEDPLVHALPEKGVRVEQADHWLSRVVDARRALEIRGYPLGIRRSLVLELDDADLSWNRGAHLLEVTEGRGLVSAARGSAAPRLRLSIGAMAPLYSGHLAPSVLRAIGALQGDDNALEIAAAIFAGPRPWMADDF